MLIYIRKVKEENLHPNIVKWLPHMKGIKPMFKEIKKFNTRNEEGVALINTDTITAMVQQPKHITRLYDENENLVSETEDEPRYAVITSTNQTYVVSQATYDELKAELLK